MKRDHDTIGWLLEQIGRYPLLSVEEEVVLGRNVRAWQELKEELAVSGAEPTPKQRRVIKVGERAFKRMYTANLRLVVTIAKKYSVRARHLDLSDLVQEGAIGLARGVEKFDPGRGYKFSTYAYWWIRQGCARALCQQDRTIRLPMNGADALNRLSIWVPEFIAEHRRGPTLEEMAEATSLKPETLRLFLEHQGHVASLNAHAKHAKEGMGSALIDLQVDQSIDLWEYAEKESALDQIDQAMGSLSDMDLALLKRTYGLDGEEPQSSAKLGEELGMSRQAVSNRILTAVKRLRKHCDVAA